MRLALRGVVKNAWDFVDVILLYCVSPVIPKITGLNYWVGFEFEKTFFTTIALVSFVEICRKS